MAEVLSLLVGDKDLEAVNDLGERDSLVLLPVLNGLSTLGEDNEVVVVALVVDSDLGSVSAHLGMCWGGCVGLGFVGYCWCCE
jgi:hypothetical protein